ncbi:MAG: hypothetical protein Q8M79_07580, partial [Dehalococcoidia bacterium]|nr:hypothetical protein [Dehalococcoidia bacterium]
VTDADGTCALTATRAADDNYLVSASSAAFAVTLLREPQTTAVVVTGPVHVFFGETDTATATGGNGTGALVFSHGASTGCTVSGTTVSVTNASGTCVLTAVRLGDATYEQSAVSADFTVDLHRANQLAPTVTGPTSVTFGTTGVASASGGSGTGAYIFSTGASTGCSVAGTTVAVTSASGSCALTAVRLGDTNYNSSPASAAFTVTLVKGNQAAVTVIAPSTVSAATPRTAVATGGSGTGAYVFSAGASTGCSVSVTTVILTDADGTCTITATRAADGNYLVSAASAPFAVTLLREPQTTAVVVTGPVSLTFGATGTATATGGNGTGAYLFGHGTSTGCTVSGTTVTVTNASGTCMLIAVRLGDATYNVSASSADFTVSLAKANQTAPIVTGPASVTFGTTGTASASGGQGTGGYVFSAGASTGCSVSGTTVTVISASGTCALTAGRAGDDNYNPSPLSTAFVVTLNGAPGGGATGGGATGGGAPAPEPAPEFVVEHGIIGLVPLIDVESKLTSLTGTTSVSSTSTQGSMTVNVPAGAFMAGTTIRVGAAANLAALSHGAPPPDGVDLLAAFHVEALSASGTEITAEFAPPVTVTLRVEASAVPAGATPSMLSLAFWNGSEWAIVPSTIVVSLDGSITITTLVTHLGLFSVLYQPPLGQFIPIPNPTTGTVTLTIWGGGDYAMLDAALTVGDSVWITFGGRWMVYVVGAPPFVNAAVLAIYPDGLPDGMPVVVSR